MNPSESTAGIVPSASPRSSGRWFWPLAMLTLATGSASILLVSQMPAAPMAATVEVAKPRALRLHPVELVTLEPQRIGDLVKVTGTIKPAQEAAIAAQVGGPAETVAVRPGDHVAAGQLLVEVGTRDLRLQLDQQRSTRASSVVQLRAAEATLQRTKLLAEKGLAARTTLDTAQAEVDQLVAAIATQESQVGLAEANLERARVTAPFSGTVATREIEPGQVINPGTTMLSIVDLSTVRVEVIASLKDSARIRVGQTVRLSVHGLKGEHFAGTVDRVSPVAEAGTRSIKVYLSLDNPERTLRGGMFVNGEIVVEEENNVIAVPTSAIHTREDTSYVLAIINGVLREQPVETGKEWTTTGLVEARSGIAAGDVIIGVPLSGLADGAAVVVEEN